MENNNMDIGTGRCDFCHHFHVSRKIVNIPPSTY
jgi:hypothetical protein